MSQESNDSVCRELDRANEQLIQEGAAIMDRLMFKGAVALVLECGLATGHAATWDELRGHVREQIEEYRNIHIALMNVMQEVDAVGSVSVGTAEAARAALTAAHGKPTQ